MSMYHGVDLQICCNIKQVYSNMQLNNYNIKVLLLKILTAKIMGGEVKEKSHYTSCIIRHIHPTTYLYITAFSTRIIKFSGSKLDHGNFLK